MRIQVAFVWTQQENATEKDDKLKNRVDEGHYHFRVFTEATVTGQPEISG